MKTYYDLEEKEQEKLDEIIDYSNMNRDILDEYRPPAHSEFGLCASCSRFDLAETEFKVIIAMCNYFKMPLSTAHPIKKCTSFRKRGGMNLWEMKSMATLIDPPKKKAGFITEEEK